MYLATLAAACSIFVDSTLSSIPSLTSFVFSRRQEVSCKTIAYSGILDALAQRNVHCAGPRNDTTDLEASQLLSVLFCHAFERRSDKNLVLSCLRALLARPWGRKGLPRMYSVLVHPSRAVFALIGVHIMPPRVLVMLRSFLKAWGRCASSDLNQSDLSRAVFCEALGQHAGLID